MGAMRVLGWGAAAAAPARAADRFVSVGDELAVGKNRTGEACRLKLMGIRTDTGFRHFGLFCEGWTQPSGVIWSFSVAKGYALDKLLTDSTWEKNFSQRLGGCGAVEATTLGSGTPAALRECRPRRFARHRRGC